ncbi:MAG: lipopolysaccharide biosynthesis protein RfbH [Candidatus Omnitrophota bacterium]
MKDIKKDILKYARQHLKGAGKRKPFVVGVSRVPYAGRIFDYKEIMNLIDASVDFWLTSGVYAKKFEQDLAKWLGVRHVLLTNSGSSANLLAVSALTSSKLGQKRLKPGDEVITVACGFPTTLNPILQNGLIPVFVDVELGTYNICADQVERAVSKKTKAIFVAHTLGNPMDLDKILKIVKKHKLWLIEDNCDSLGSKYGSRFTGTFGHISTCSFYPPHHITMGEGGAVLTNDPLLRKLILSFRDWGRDCWCESGRDDSCGKRFSQKFGDLPFGYDHKYVYSHIGYNLKVTDLQAAIGCAQLDKLSGFVKARQKNFQYLYQHLKRYQCYFLLPEAQEKAEPSWFGFPLFVKKDAPFSRNNIVEFLEKRKIATRMLFGGNLLKQPAYRNMKYRCCGGLKNTDDVMNRLFWIGVYPGITPEMMRYVLSVFDEFFKNIESKIGESYV